MFIQLKQNIFKILFLTFLVEIFISCHKAEVSVSNSASIKFYGGPLNDVPSAVIQTSDGGFAITGYTDRNLNNDMFLLKLDHNGNQQWFKTYGGPNDDVGNALVQTADGGFLVTGSTNSFGNAIQFNTSYTDVYAVRTNTNGDTIWTRTYGLNLSTNNPHAYYDDAAYSVCNAADGSHYISGFTQNYVISNSAYGASLVIKIKDNGDTIWTKGYDPYTVYLESNFGAGILEDKDHNIVTCSFEDSLLFKKINPNGSVIWSSKNGSIGRQLVYYDCYFDDFIQEPGGSYNILITSTFLGSLPNTPYFNSGYFTHVRGINVSNDGSHVRTQVFDSTKVGNLIGCGSLMSNGNYVFSFSQPNKNPLQQTPIIGPGGFSLLESDPSGKSKLLKTLGGWPVSIVPDNNGNLFITGYSNKVGTSKTTIFTEWLSSGGNIQ